MHDLQSDYALFDAVDERPRVDYARWLLTLVCWDGLLPLLVLASPYLLDALTPNRDAREFFEVIVPTAACIVRLLVGIRHIRVNRTGSIVRASQYAVFVFAVLILCSIDAVVILEKGFPPPQDAIELLAVMAVASIYLALMAFALYPGREIAGQAAAAD